MLKNKERLSDDRIIQIALKLTTEKDFDRLMADIIEEAMTLTNCDGGTIYSLEGEDLFFQDMITLSKGFHKSRSLGEIDLPPVNLNAENISAISAREKKRINIPDIYDSTEYDFSGPQKYDALNGYRTTSMLVLPMIDDKDKVIGVLQLINAQDEDGKVIPFSEDYEMTVAAMTNLAAVSMNNHRLTKEISETLHAFVKVMAKAIDMRSSYNANHTRSMVRYSQRFIKWLNERGGDWTFDEDHEDSFLMSVWLHDIGKLIIPLEIMDKPTRLGEGEAPFRHKVEVGILMQRIRKAEHPEESAAAEEEIAKLSEARDFVLEKNGLGFLPDDVLDHIREIATYRLLNSEGEEIPFLNEQELQYMTIRKGTLSDEEREIMQSHVVYTAKMLGEMKFSGYYSEVPFWAGAHHECLNGSGYPNKLTAEDIPKEVRLLSIVDVYDALTAEDRPYKKPMPGEKALGILHSMVDEGKLDGEILGLFEESGAWKREEA
jgi:HD-GYP domain-containing protein (c-di-GMP phosphodiesterase class II)